MKLKRNPASQLYLARSQIISNALDENENKKRSELSKNLSNDSDSEGWIDCEDGMCVRMETFCNGRLNCPSRIDELVCNSQADKPRKTLGDRLFDERSKFF